MMNRRALAFFMVCLVGLCWSSIASAAGVEVEAIDGGVQVVDRSGQVLVEHYHPALFSEPRGYRQRQGGRRPVGPINGEGASYYAVGHQLLAFDAHRQTLTQRWRMPANIVAMEWGQQGQLRLSLEAYAYGAEPAEGADDQAEPKWVVIDYHPGQAVPGRGSWDWGGTMTPLSDVMWLEGVPLEAEPGASTEPVNRDQSQDAALVDALAEREGFDKTNPYLALYRGEALLRLGDQEEAQQAFEAALEHGQADWIDLLRMAMRLEFRGQQQLAQRAFDRAATKSEEAALRGDYIVTMANATFAMVWHGEVMRQALASRDVAKAHRVAGYIDGLFPNLEGAPLAWSRLANWLEEQGAYEEASHWRQRVDELQQQRRSDAFYETASRRVDWYLTGQLALFITVLLAGGLLGIRRSPKDETERAEDHIEEKDRRFWVRLMPRFYVGDIAALAVLFGVLLVLPMTLGSPLHSMVTIAEAPAAVSGDAMASPTAARWLETLADSPAKEALKAEWEAEFQALQEGQRGSGEAKIDRLLIAAVDADARARAPGSFGELEASTGTTQDFPWLGPLLEFGHGLRGATLLFLVLTINALIFGGLLQAVIRRSPKVGEVGRMIIPGGPRSLGFLRLAVLALFVLGLVRLTPLNRAAQAMTEAELVRYFGLENGPQIGEADATMVALAMITVALVVHAVGVVLDSRQQS